VHNVVLLTVALAASAAHAQSAQGFGVNLYSPSERGAEWFALDSLQLRGNLATTIGLVADYSSRTLSLYNAQGREQSVLVGSQTYGYLGANMVLWDRLRVGLMLPVDLYQTGHDFDFEGTHYAVQRSLGLGDVRVSAQVRLVGEYGQPFTLAFGTGVYFPTGLAARYNGDGKISIRPELLAAGDIGQFAYALRAGFDYHHALVVFDDTPTGSAITVGAAAGARFGDKREWLIGAEVLSNLITRDFFTRLTSATEILASAHVKLPAGLQLGLAAGPGLGRGLGTPRYRVLFSLDWTIPAGNVSAGYVPPDSDQDGIPDSQDACPETVGKPSNIPELNGCPPTQDRDRDGVRDDVDACPDTPGDYQTDPARNGCPIQ
jgi:hypothetical protein